MKNLTAKMLDNIIDLILNSLTCQNTRRVYQIALSDFRNWYSRHCQTGLNRVLVQAFIREMMDQGMRAGSINLRLITIRRLAQEATDNELLDPWVASGIMRIKSVRAEGRRLGHWLTKAQAQDLLNTVDISTLKGKRDKAILAVLLSTGIRREEAANLTFEHIQMRENRWVIVDLLGKRNSLRSIPMPKWCKDAIDEWSKAAGIRTGRIFRRFRHGDHIDGDCMTAQAIYDLVLIYSKGVGIENFAPHSCRRTFAKLAHKGGSPIEQIQYSLGHASIRTTEIYLGIEQNLVDAPCDHLGLSAADI
jgi:site-specific recombinase XerD